YPRWLVRHRIIRLQKPTTQEKHNDHREKQVNSCKHNERHDQAAHRRHGFMGPHHPINYPRLPSQFGYDPPGFNRQKSQRPGGDESTQKPFVSGKTPVSQPRPTRTQYYRQHNHARTDHDVERPMYDANIGPLVAGKFLQTDHSGSEVVRDEEAQPARDTDRMVSRQSLTIWNSANN